MLLVCWLNLTAILYSTVKTKGTLAYTSLCRVTPQAQPFVLSQVKFRRGPCWRCFQRHLHGVPFSIDEASGTSTNIPQRYPLNLASTCSDQLAPINLLRSAVPCSASLRSTCSDLGRPGAACCHYFSFSSQMLDACACMFVCV
jgi:hypothetical protein